MSPSITSTLAFHSCITLSPNTRSKGNEKYKEEEEEKLHYTTLNYKIENENYPKLCISSTLEPRGVFIATREGGPGGQPLAQNATAKMWPRPRFRGHMMAARAALRAARCLVCPLSGDVPNFWFLAPDFNESALLGQWLNM